MLEPVESLLQRYDISHYGFLPIDEPLAHLPDDYYAPWEALIARLPDVIKQKCFHDEVANLPLLSTSRLQSLPEWRRAYVILSFFTHAYIWSGDKPCEVLPSNLAIPLLSVSDHLKLPPTATYPALNLWNCGLVADGADICNPENVVMRHTFTGTPDEAWFYAVSVSVEARGIEAIRIMLECIKAVNEGNGDSVAKCLAVFADVIVDLGRILRRMHEKCQPEVFYYQIRPFLAGSRGMEKAGLPQGIFYDEGDKRGTWRQYSGGSNAQSTLIQFLDIVLGVRHKAQGSQSTLQTSKEATYLDEMRNYMPESHRRFLQYIDSMTNVQQYVQQLPSTSTVCQSFNRAVDALAEFRDIHINIVARYIISPSRNASAMAADARKNIASASSDPSTDPKDLKGTGGTDLMSFLKQTRDETKAARTTSV